MIDAEQKSFIEELRSLSVPAKRKVMLGATATSMILIVYLWLAYFNTIIPNTTPSGLTQAPAMTSAQNVSEPGIVGLFASAASSFWQAIGNGAREAAGTLKDPKQYNVSPR